MAKATEHDFISVRGAREHNLKGVDLDFPRDSLTTFTGVSGSGKSSLAYHTIYQEGQRRFLESLSSYARQFLGRMEKPKVDHVEGLSPTVSIDQKSVGTSPRSTVGTLTEILDFLRLFMARLGTPTCPTCGAVIESWSVDQIVAAILERHRGAALLVLAPVVRDRKGEYRKELTEFRSKGFVRARIDGEVRRLDEDIALHRYKYHTIELVLDRLRIEGDEVASRLAEAVESALALADGLCAVVNREGEGYELFSTSRACPAGHGVVPEMEPRLFSFNSPVGACQECDGLGEVHSFSEALLVRDPGLSIREGAIAAFTAEGKLAYGRITVEHLAMVAADHGFDVDTPWRDLTKAQQRVVWRGSGQKSYRFDWKRKGQNYTASGHETQAFPGVIPHLKRVYRNATARHLDRFRAATVCEACEGTRLNPQANAVTFDGRSLPDWVRWSVREAAEYFGGLRLQGNQAAIGKEILIAIQARLRFLLEVGLGYLTLERRAATLSGGESQRIRLAAQVGAGLRGILYVLDEPSIGLHPRDQELLLGILANLRDRGNTVCVVEHDEATMAFSDWLVDVGPGAGRNGGELVSSGPPSEVFASDSLTARYLRGELRIPVPETRRAGNGAVLEVRGARHHNLKDLDVQFPLGRLIAVTGVSGSGKSTLLNHILKKALRRDLNRADDVPGEHDEIRGLEHLDKVIEISQSPIGRTPRSNPATYTGVWDHVRDLFAKLPESRMRAYPKGRFSFNVAGGRCEACDGAGVLILEMQFLSPVEVTCEECNGRRFNPETLDIAFKDKNVSDYLEMSVDEAYEYFQAIPKIARGLEALRDVGLGYIHLGQTSTTLSGGEAQRVKLATELQRPATGRTIYILDEPTTGLHFDDIRKLLLCLHRLVDGGNTVVVIEHNLDVIKSADHVIDLGPEGGDGGGEVVFAGTPEALCKAKGSHTGKALQPVLFPKPRSAGGGRLRKPKRGKPDDMIRVVGATKNNLQSVNVDLPIGKFNVITGVSGSGKSSLAFDTLFGEGQRRFIESLSTYARRFLGRMDRAPVDRLEGLGPAIAIDQKASHRSPRSTVATATEIHDYLRLLYARIGRPHCPDHGQELVLHSPSSIAKTLLADFPDRRGYILAPVTIPGTAQGSQDKLRKFVAGLQEAWVNDGFVRALVDGEEVRLEQPIPLPKGKGAVPELHLVVDRVTFKDRGRLVDSAELAGRMGHGRLIVRAFTGKVGGQFEERIFTTDRSCPRCGHGVPENPHPRYFSFNHHSGACGSCSGLGQVVACDPALLVNHPHLPTFDGGIEHKGGAFTFLTKKSGWYVKIAKVVAKKYGFDLRDPFRDLSEEAQAILLWGTGEERHEITYRSTRSRGKRTYNMAVQWKGLCTQIEEWVHSGGSSEDTKDKMRAVMGSGPCTECGGDRLARAQRHVLIGGRSLPAFTHLSVDDALAALDKLRPRRNERQIAADILVEIRDRLLFLQKVGLGYLTLDRSARTLSGGEAQRIRLASQLGNRLVGVLYVLDEPTVGLHPRDTAQLLDTLRDLRDLGNTVVAVEHDEAVMRAADHLVDMGPGAGHQGGRVVASGTPAQVMESKGLTGQYLRGRLSIPVPAHRRVAKASVRLRGVTKNNLQKVDAAFPMGVLTAVTGVSGSGKSSLVLDALLPALNEGSVLPRGFKDAQVIVVDQSPIGSTPASNPATYTGVFTPVRELFAELPVSKIKGFGPGRFSFNMRGGRCEACEGKGQLRVEMHFLADVWVTCDVCGGKRFNAETLGVELRNRNIAEVLDMEVGVAVDFFGNHPRIRRPLQAMVDVGLGYLRLGQPGNTLSGGESQRIKLVAQLARPARRHHVYLLDEPTTGLHLDDVAKLVDVLHRLVDHDHTVIVIEHHLDVVKNADHVIELGPEAGPKGGKVVVTGTPEEVAAHKQSVTGRFLAPLLSGGRKRRAGARAQEA